MKEFIAPVVISICALAACSSPDSKFLGKWHDAKSDRPDTIIIEKKGEVYDAYHSGKPDDFMTFNYDKDHDVLTMEKRGDVFDITYIDSTKHLILAPREKRGFRNDAIELERVK